jgi:hypothetical protein
MHVEKLAQRHLLVATLASSDDWPRTVSNCTESTSKGMAEGVLSDKVKGMAGPFARKKRRIVRWKTWRSLESKIKISI